MVLGKTRPLADAWGYVNVGTYRSVPKLPSLFNRITRRDILIEGDDRMHKLSCLSTLIVGGALAMAPALQARTCSGNADLLGGYGWSGSRPAAFVATTPVT